MKNIPLSDILARMPVEELEESLNDFLVPMMEYLLEERLRRIVPETVGGILSQEAPVIAGMAQSTPRRERELLGRIEVYNGRLHRWETEHLQDLTDCVPRQVTYQVAFQHARRTHQTDLKMGYFRIRLQDTPSDPMGSGGKRQSTSPSPQPAHQHPPPPCPDRPAGLCRLALARPD
jgi:hypothetical protein